MWHPGGGQHGTSPSRTGGHQWPGGSTARLHQPRGPSHAALPPSPLPSHPESSGSQLCSSPSPAGGCLVTQAHQVAVVMGPGKGDSRRWQPALEDPDTQTCDASSQAGSRKCRLAKAVVQGTPGSSQKLWGAAKVRAHRGRSSQALEVLAAARGHGPGSHPGPLGRLC